MTSRSESAIASQLDLPRPARRPTSSTYSSGGPSPSLRWAQPGNSRRRPRRTTSASCPAGTPPPAEREQQRSPGLDLDPRQQVQVADRGRFQLFDSAGASSVSSAMVIMRPDFIRHLPTGLDSFFGLACADRRKL